MGQKLYTVTEAAEMLKIHPKTLRRRIKDGEVQVTMVGQRYRFTQAQLEDYCGSSLDQAEPYSQQRKVIVSTVVDIHAISPDESSRITNYLLASQKNSRDSETGSTIRIDSIYHPEIGYLKVLLTGDSATVRRLMALIETLLSAKD